MTAAQEKLALRAARHSILVNVGLSAFKLVAGVVGHSAAMVSDAVHSMTDMVSTFIAMIGVKLANKQPDKEHPYGHERFESVATLVLAVLVLTVGLGIGWAGVQTIVAGEFAGLPAPGLIALVAAAVSIAAKEAVFWYMRAVARKVNSGALMADAWHSRVDGISSVGSFVGILAARLGFAVMDAVAALVIGLFIIKTAISIMRDALGRMTDRAADDATVAQFNEFILAQPHVRGIDLLRTRLFGSRIYIDVDICVDAALTVGAAHDIAQQVHDAIEQQFATVKHCMVHVHPATEPAADYPV